MYVEVDPSGADSWKLESVVNLLKEGAVGVIPTDTVYEFVSNLMQFFIPFFIFLIFIWLSNCILSLFLGMHLFVI